MSEKSSRGVKINPPWWTHYPYMMQIQMTRHWELKNNRNGKWSSCACFPSVGYIWAMENHFYRYFPKLWKEHLCSSLSVCKRESLFVFKKRKAKKWTFIVLFWGVCTVPSALYTRLASVNPQNYCLNLLSACPPLSATLVWLLFTTNHWDSSCQGPQRMTLNPGDIFRSLLYLAP